MAVKAPKAEKRVSSPPQIESETKEIELQEITANTAQSRGMGVLANLHEQGYGLFFPIEGHEEKEPIWTLLFSDKPEDRQLAVSLIEEHESNIADLADSQLRSGQLQTIGVYEKDGKFDVVYGMRRAIARALNFARDKKNPGTIQARIFASELKPVELKYLALEENDNREEESPVDRALTYKWFVDQGESPQEIGKRTGQSDQNIRNHLKLLDSKLEDKRWAIHTRQLSVDRALKLLRKRKGKDDGENRQTEEGKRMRMPSVKLLERIYGGYQPKGMDDKEFELWKAPEVRKLLSYKLGVKFSEYKEPKPEKKLAKDEKVESNGEATAEGGKKGKILSVKRERAVALLVSLGKVNARGWSDETLASKLESIVNIVEPDQKAETESLQKLLDKLIAGYSENMQVRIVES